MTEVLVYSISPFPIYSTKRRKRQRYSLFQTVNNHIILLAIKNALIQKCLGYLPSISVFVVLLYNCHTDQIHLQKCPRKPMAKCETCAMLCVVVNEIQINRSCIEIFDLFTNGICTKQNNLFFRSVTSAGDYNAIGYLHNN